MQPYSDCTAFCSVRFWVCYTAATAAMILNSSSRLMNTQDSWELLVSSNSSVRYQIGNPHFEGRTTVVIQGNGTASVEFVRGAEKRSYLKQLAPERLEEVRSTLAAYDPRKLTASQKDLVPDEAQIQIEIVEGDRTWVRTFRDQDRWDQSNLQKDVELFGSVAYEVSDGNVQF
jgi:Flp pilus assembly secretin CpaC